MWKYKIGTVVREKSDTLSANLLGRDRRPRWGHVVGFSQVEYQHGAYPILLIQWQDGSKSPYNQSNLMFEGDCE